MLFEFSNAMQILLNYSINIQTGCCRTLFVLILFLSECAARRLNDIYWNSSSTMFDISNTDHVKKVNLLDRITILCPRPTQSLYNYEYSKLYIVSREGYDNCELRDEKQIGVCVTPKHQSSISLVFRSFSPLLSSLQFQAGKSYYVISTSDGTTTGLNKSAGGLCLKKNMKLKFDINSEILKSNSIRTLDSTSFSILPSLNKDSTSPPILYIIHTSEPELNILRSEVIENAATTISNLLSRSFIFKNSNKEVQKQNNNVLLAQKQNQILNLPNSFLATKSTNTINIVLCLLILIRLINQFCFAI